MMETIENQEVTHRVDEPGFFGKDAKKSKSSIGERIIAIREAMKMTQKAFASFCGMPLPSLKDYEAGKRMPGGEALQHFIDAGINANWLLTGDGDMLLNDPRRDGTTVDLRRLETAIRELDAALGRARRTLDPERKARAVGVLYEFQGQAGGNKPVAVDRLLDLVP